MNVWVAGDNLPGQLPDAEPIRFDDWESATRHLIELMGEHYATGTDHSPIPFLQARAVVKHARPDTPLSLFYEGRVYWIADLPT